MTTTSHLIWIKKRIADYDFVENQDYISFHKKMERVVGGTVRIEYFEKSIDKFKAILENA